MRAPGGSLSLCAAVVLVLCAGTAQGIRHGPMLRGTTAIFVFPLPKPDRSLEALPALHVAGDGLEMLDDGFSVNDQAFPSEEVFGADITPLIDGPELFAKRWHALQSMHVDPVGHSLRRHSKCRHSHRHHGGHMMGQGHAHHGGDIHLQLVSDPLLLHLTRDLPHPHPHPHPQLHWQRPKHIHTHRIGTKRAVIEDDAGSRGVSTVWTELRPHIQNAPRAESMSVGLAPRKWAAHRDFMARHRAQKGGWQKVGLGETIQEPEWRRVEYPGFDRVISGAWNGTRGPAMVFLLITVACVAVWARLLVLWCLCAIRDGPREHRRRLRHHRCVLPRWLRGDGDDDAAAPGAVGEAAGIKQPLLEKLGPEPAWARVINASDYAVKVHGVQDKSAQSSMGSDLKHVTLHYQPLASEMK